jgi:hypothetical protein
MRRQVEVALALMVVSLGAALACGPGSLRAAGTSCSSDGQCAAGLQCLALTVSSADDAGCTPFVSVCSKTCQTDPDCAAVGPSYTCFAMCAGGTNVCAETSAGDAGVDSGLD